MRKEAGFEVMDKIVLSFKAEKTICEVFAAHKCKKFRVKYLRSDIKEGALEGIPERVEYQRRTSVDVRSGKTVIGKIYLFDKKEFIK